MNTQKSITAHLAQNLVSKMIKRDMSGWPPDCLALTYQPVRPACEAIDKSESTLNEKNK